MKVSGSKRRCVVPSRQGWRSWNRTLPVESSVRLWPEKGGHTRALLDAAFAGDLDEGKVEYEMHPVFNLKMPTSCPGVPAEILNPRNTWEDKAAYDAQAEKLRDMFRKNFEEKGFGAPGIEPAM